MQISIFDGAEPFRINKPIRLIELFAGIGAQAKALENIGAEFEHYRICEFDKYAVQSYNAIHGTHFLPSDIAKLTADDLEIIDTDKYCYIMTYSFPCQDLSKAGKQRGMDKDSGTRSGLLWEAERILSESEELPQVLLMENVPDVHGEKNADNFRKWCEKLETLGYHNYWKDLNAKNFQIPQNRERCFMVSILGNYYYDFPKSERLTLRLSSLLEFSEDYKVDLKNLNKTQKLAIEIVSNHIEKDISKVIRSSGLKSYDKHSWAVYSVDLRQSESFIRTIKNFAKTICAQHRGSFTSDGKIYYDYSPKECWRLMGFSDEDFEKAKTSGVSNSQLYKQAGNSIVVSVLEAIFKKLF